MINYEENICNSYPKKLRQRGPTIEINQQAEGIKGKRKKQNTFHKKRKQIARKRVKYFRETRI